MYINRLFGIIHILLNQKRTTSNELANHFEVSKRTILRDLDILSSAGVPIYTTKGKGGGIAILDGYTLDKMAITDDDQNKILNALQCMQSLTTTEESNELLSKLSDLFGKAQTDWIDVDFSNWGHYDHNQIKFDCLKHAIINKQIVTFHYSNNAGETSFRTAYPCKLFFKSQAWYLQAYCQTKFDYRFFKLNRINELGQLEEYFNKLDIPPLPCIQNIPNINELGPIIRLVIRFSENIAYRIYDEFPLQEIIKNRDNTLTVTTNILPEDWLYQYLLSFGSNAEVLEPQFIRDILKQKAEQIKNLGLRKLT